MSFRYSSAVINSIAPELATFQEVEVPDLASDFPQAPHWVVNFFLNVIFRGGYADRYKQAALGFLRRADHAFRAYHDARERTHEYVAKFEEGQPRVRLYYSALAEWETFVLQLQMAADLYLFFSKQRIFEPNDNSPEQRLYDLANAVKHFRGHLSSKKFSPGDLLAQVDVSRDAKDLRAGFGSKETAVADQERGAN